MWRTNQNNERIWCWQVASIESRGFIFAGTIARDLELPFVLARKPGKLPNQTYKKSFDLEYGSTSIEIQQNTNVNKDQKIVIVDDLVATGGTAIACAELFTENFNINASDILILTVIAVSYTHLTLPTSSRV